MKLKSFEEKLKYGREFEDKFSKWLMNKNWFVTPKYLFAGKGAPLLIGKNEKYAIPDIDAAKEGKRIWFECKRKNRMKKYPATGYPFAHHTNYKKIQEITGDKVFIIFEDNTKQLEYYGNYIDELDKNVFSDNFYFDGKRHIVFNYPKAFIPIKIK